jgi:hypothetical protein
LAGKVALESDLEEYEKNNFDMHLWNLINFAATPVDEITIV